MITALTRPMCLTLWLALPLSVWAQTPAVTDTPALPLAADSALTPAPLSPAPAPEGCRSLTDKATAADMKAVTAQSQKLELSEQLRLFEATAGLWSQAEAQCEGRAKERAQRNLSDSQKMRTSIDEQLGSGPQCAAAQKDAGALQDIARQALSERRWSEASMLFHKAENMWDLAAERCTGGQQEIAIRRRDQSDVDGQNAEFCAPLFDKAREQTQKLRASAAGLSREDKQDASMVAETLWRDAVAQCKGPTVQDSARNNAQALARERGTPWVARVAPAPQPSPSTQIAGAHMVTTSTPSQASGPGASTRSGAVPKPSLIETPPADFSANTTRFSGQFVRDADGASYSGTGKVVWAHGDVFEGTLVKGQRHGKGLFVWANGQRYNGDWVQDKATGQASVQFANGNQFEGSVLEGVPQGQGRMRYASGDTYTGQFNAGVPEGVGLYAWKNGQQFDGAWKNGRPNGQGKLRFATGNQFEGAVVEGVPHGEGRMVFASGEIYVGHFANGQPDGQGSFSFANGEKYVGQFRDGKFNGQGALTIFANGRQYVGEFRDGKRSGSGTEYGADGTALRSGGWEE